MSEKVKERFFGMVATILTVAFTFLVSSYFGSFETKADAMTKYQIIDKKLSLVLCYLNNKHCIKE